jgi:septal ring factor EnvC (AmiA/AmiB activator)
MTTHIEQSEFDKSLEAFESQLATPLVPGEVLQWSDLTAKATEQLRRVLETRRAEYEAQLKEIAAQDAEMLRRVEQLQTLRDDVFKRFEQLDRLIAAIKKPVDIDEDREAKMRPAIEKLSADGLALAIDVRKLDREIATWYVEAFQRDRGVVD